MELGSVEASGAGRPIRCRSSGLKSLASGALPIWLTSCSKVTGSPVDRRLFMAWTRPCSRVCVMALRGVTAAIRDAKSAKLLES